MQCRELHPDSSIRDAAIKQMNQRVLAFVSRDLVAAEDYKNRPIIAYIHLCPQFGDLQTVVACMTINKSTRKMNMMKL